MVVVNFASAFIRKFQSWALWQVEPRARYFLLGTELSAVWLILDSFHDSASTEPALLRLLVLFAMSAAYGEVCDRMESLRRFLGADGVVSNHNSVLCFAGLLALPLHLAGALTVAVYSHTLVRSRRHNSAYAHRLIFTAAAAILATFVAGDLYHALGGGMGPVSLGDSVLILATLLVYVGSNLTVLVAGMYLAAGPSLTRWQSLLPGRHQVEYETSTLLLGLFTGFLMQTSPWLCPAVLLLVAILQRSSLVADLQRAASRDSKTALLNYRAWYALAETYLVGAHKSAVSIAVLLVDVDHFKRVNDTHGHLVGDQVLRVVADILSSELRGYDAIGRFGGEEFIILLPATDSDQAADVAQRLCDRIRTETMITDIAITVSIGGAACVPTVGRELTQLIAAADLALYRAKRSGRDQILLGQLL